VHLVEEIDALDGDVIILGAHHVRVILELLDVDHSDLRPAGVVVQGLGCLDVAGEGFACVNSVHGQATAGKFALCLDEQVDAVNDEVELGDDAPLLEIIGQKARIVVGQRGLAAALGVPDDSLAHPGIELALNRLGGEELGVTHDVLLQAVGFVHIDQGVFQQERQAVAAEQRGADAVGRRVRRFVAGEFRAVLDDVEVVVA